MNCLPTIPGQRSPFFSYLASPPAFPHLSNAISACYKVTFPSLSDHTAPDLEHLPLPTGQDANPFVWHKKKSPLCSSYPGLSQQSCLQPYSHDMVVSFQLQLWAGQLRPGFPSLCSDHTFCRTCLCPAHAHL